MPSFLSLPKGFRREFPEGYKDHKAVGYEVVCATDEAMRKAKVWASIVNGQNRVLAALRAAFRYCKLKFHSGVIVLLSVGTKLQFLVPVLQYGGKFVGYAAELAAFFFPAVGNSLSSCAGTMAARGLWLRDRMALYFSPENENVLRRLKEWLDSEYVENAEDGEGIDSIVAFDEDDEIYKDIEAGAGQVPDQPTVRSDSGSNKKDPPYTEDDLVARIDKSPEQLAIVFVEQLGIPSQLSALVVSLLELEPEAQASRLDAVKLHKILWGK